MLTNLLSCWIVRQDTVLAGDIFLNSNTSCYDSAPTREAYKYWINDRTQQFVFKIRNMSRNFVFCEICLVSPLVLFRKSKLNLIKFVFLPLPLINEPLRDFAETLRSDWKTVETFPSRTYPSIIYFYNKINVVHQN